MIPQTKYFAILILALSFSIAAKASISCDYEFRGSTMRISASSITRLVQGEADREYQRGADNSPKTWTQIVASHKNLDNPKAKATNFTVSVLPAKGTDLDGKPADLVLKYSPKSTYVNSWENFEIRNTQDTKNGRRISVDVKRRLVSVFEMTQTASGATERLLQSDIPTTCKTDGTGF